MKASTASRLITVVLGLVVALSTLLVWLDPFQMTLFEWQGTSDSIGGGFAWDAWGAIACGLIGGLVARARDTVGMAFLSFGLSLAGITLLALFMSRIGDRLEGVDIFGPGPIVAGVALLAMFISSLNWAVAALKESAARGRAGVE